MKVYLDDIREEPEGWTRTYTVKQTIELLKTGQVTEVSLDHDLAFLHYAGDYSKEETGYSVLLWIEEQVIKNNFVPPKMYIHTGNPSAMIRMKQAVESINKIYNERSKGA